MSIRLANALFNEARTVVGAGQIKNTIQIKVHDNGDVTDANDMPLNILNLGNRGDNCVTEIRFLLPEELKTGYAHFFIVDLPNELYIQKCDLQTDYASAWIESSITLSQYKNNLNMLYAAIEEEALDDAGNISDLTEIFVSDELYGIVEQNFLATGWHGPLTGEVTASEESIVNDLNPGDNPDHYIPMTWVNGETKLNAANMNNIMMGIDEAAKDNDVIHKGSASSYINEDIYGLKTFKDYLVIGDGRTNGMFVLVGDSPVHFASSMASMRVDSANHSIKIDFAQYSPESTNEVLTFPRKTGTVALTEDCIKLYKHTIRNSLTPTAAPIILISYDNTPFTSLPDLVNHFGEKILTGYYVNNAAKILTIVADAADNYKIKVICMPSTASPNNLFDSLFIGDWTIEDTVTSL